MTDDWKDGWAISNEFSSFYDQLRGTEELFPHEQHTHTHTCRFTLNESERDIWDDECWHEGEVSILMRHSSLSWQLHWKIAFLKMSTAKILRVYVIVGADDDLNRENRCSKRVSLRLPWFLIDFDDFSHKTWRDGPARDGRTRWFDIVSNVAMINESSS